MSKITLTLLFFITCTFCSFAQEVKDDQPDSTDPSRSTDFQSIPTLADTTFNANDEIFTVVEQIPQFKGGEGARMRYLMENINYPEKGNIIEGTVYASFVIEKSGRVNDVRIIRGLGDDFDKEVVRVIKGMPKWKPGRQRGKPVRVQFIMPIKFSLSQEEVK